MKPSLAPLVLGFALFLGCGGPLRYQAKSTNLAPGGDAEIVAEVDRATHKTKVTVNVSNLTPAKRIDENKGYFVFWHRQSSESPWARLGGLEFDEEARTGKFEGSVPETAFDLVVTVEEDLNPDNPSDQVVFSQHIAD